MSKLNLLLVEIRYNQLSFEKSKIMSREQKKQHTREKILVTAETLFGALGYDAVSTRQIAKECGVSIGTVFAHFNDKKHLTQALFHRKLEVQLREQQQEFVPSNGLEYFLGKTAFLYKFYEQDRAFSVALLQNSLFDFDYFQQQFEDFIVEVSVHLTNELPEHSVKSREVIAKAWFGYYFFHLLQGLAQEKSSSEHWLSKLKIDCKQLLNTIQ